jgi:eukaryotic-like serine/threonine-protein kinase
MSTDVATAVQAVVQAGLIPVVQWARDPVVASGYVVSQVPAAGGTVRVGSVVTLVVSSGSGGVLGSVTVPNVVGLAWLDATSALQAASVSLGKYQWVADASAAGSVIGQSLLAGSSVAPGAVVQLTLSAGPTIVPGTVTVPTVS